MHHSTAFARATRPPLPGLTLATLALTLTACWDVAENDQRAAPGNQRAGNSVLTDLSVSPEGRFVVLVSNDTITTLDLNDLSVARIDLPLSSRFVFANPGTAWFSASESTDHRLELIDLSSGDVLRTLPTDYALDGLSWHPPTRRVAAWSRMYGNRVIVVPEEGPGWQYQNEQPLVDVSWLPDGTLALVEAHTWRDDSPTTRITLLSKDRDRTLLEVPNCASRLNVSPDGRHALLAPTFCQTDPVSVVDLTTRRFVKNLPGFGPVAFSPSGDYGVAFGRRNDLATFDIHTEAAYSLLFISTVDLSIEVLELGEDLPTYTVTPDGEVVLVYSMLENSSYDGIVLIDADTRTLRYAEGPELDLSEFVMTADGQLVYLIDGGLYRLDVPSGRIDYVRLPCGGRGQPSRCNPDLINLLPDEETLLLTWRDSNELALFDILEQRLKRTLVLPD